MSLALPAAGVSQEAGAPAAGAQEEGQQGPTLVVTMMQCDWDRVGEVMASTDSLAVPIWQELKDEGMILDAGSFVHQWGDEWNVGFYYVAPDNRSFFQAFAEQQRRFEERHPNAPNVVGDACPVHRDNIYVIGPSTEGGGGSQ